MVTLDNQNLVSHDNIISVHERKLPPYELLQTTAKYYSKNCPLQDMIFTGILRSSNFCSIVAFDISIPATYIIAGESP